jgi:hypothetical protein
MEIMLSAIENKLDGMFWDLAPAAKKEAVKKVAKDPVTAFSNEQVFLRALNTLGWYELIKLIGSDNLLKLLNDTTISRLFPEGRRRYYTNAKKLLSKYTLSASR